MPPINAATLVPTANSPPRQDLTRPTHSMPLTSAAAAHSPLRMCISAWLMPNAFTVKAPETLSQSDTADVLVGLNQGMRNDLWAEFTQALRARYPVEIRRE